MRFCSVLFAAALTVGSIAPARCDDGGKTPTSGERSFAGKVTETMNAASYTYVQVDTGKDKIWAAAPQFSVKVGDKVSFSGGMPMKDFESKSLNRKFDMVYFVGKIDGPGTGQPQGTTGHDAAGAPNDAAHAGLHQPKAQPAPAAPIDFKDIKKAEGGLTVNEIFQKMAKLEKKQVTFRGKVVKYNSQVMNRNWAHVQDGTGTPGANDVTVTTADTTQVGDTVLVTGTVSLNKDYGYGYKYGLVVEDAKLTVEHAK